MASHQMSGRPSVCPLFRFLEYISEAHGGDLFHIASTHPLGGIDWGLRPLIYLLTYVFRPQ